MVSAEAAKNKKFIKDGGDSPQIYRSPLGNGENRFLEGGFCFREM